MRMKTLLPWLLLAGVLVYVFTQQQWWARPSAPQALPSFGSEQGAPAAPSGPVQAQTGQGPVSYATGVAVAAPAVVNIYTTQNVRVRNPFMADPFFRHFFGEDAAPRERQQSSLGSGVIVSPEGYVLTNNHVVESADDIIVALKDGRETHAKVIGTDPGTDLAVLKITLDKLPVLPLRTSPLQVGDVVLAIGNPFGVGQTVTQGIISALGRQGLGINAFEDFIQTDAAINPGNSGGALVDVYGNLVGINSAIYSQSGGNMGIGFAIPVSLAKNVMQALIKDGKVVRGWLGVEVRELEAAAENKTGRSASHGVMLAGILRGGPAAQAGLKPGDVLKTVNGVAVSSAQQVTNLVASLTPGTAIPIRVQRQRDEIDFTVKIGERPREPRP